MKPNMVLTALALLLPAQALAADGDIMVVGGISVALAVSLVALGFSVLAARRLRKSLAQQDIVIRSVEAALVTYSRKAEHDSVTLAELAADARRDMNAISNRLLQRLEDDAAAQGVSAGDGQIARSGNVIHLSPDQAGQERKSKPTDQIQTTLPAGDRLADMLARQTLDISLQPIVSVNTSTACGFEVFACMESLDSETQFVRRLEAGARSAVRSAFERLLFEKAAETSRRQMSGNGKDHPLHVAITGALLQNDEALQAVTELYSGQPELCNSVLLSLPVHLINGASAKHGDALERLRALGVRFACEGWRGDARAMAKLAAMGVVQIKLPANRLLDREKLRPQDLSGAQLTEAAQLASIDIVATDVVHDEDAVCLIDLGVELMSGSRFSPPRKLRQTLPASKPLRAGA